MSIQQMADFRKWDFETLTGQALDYLHPSYYGQKMQQLLFYDCYPERGRLADKVAAKEYVAESAFHT